MGIENRPEMENIRRLSRVIIILCTCLQVPIVISMFVPIIILFDGEIPTYSIYGESLNNLTSGKRVVSSMILLIGTIIQYHGITLIKTLFKTYRKGIIFSTETIGCFRKMGFLMLYYMIFRMVTSAVWQIWVQRIESWRDFNVEISTNQIAFFVIGFALFAISYVMKEAHKLKQQDDLVI